MRKIIIIGVLMGCMLASYSQLVINSALPNNTVIGYKQLWNVVLIKSAPQAIQGYLRVQVINKEAGLVSYDAKSRVLVLSSAVTQLQEAQVNPIQYLQFPVQLSSNVADVLDAGTYLICYSFQELSPATKSEVKLAENCEEITVAALSSFSLVSPQDKAALNASEAFSFGWTIPSPLTNAYQLNYDFALYTIQEGQSSEDAIKNNIPLYKKNSIQGNSLAYTKQMPVLDTPYNYVWTVKAKLANRTVAATKAFTFNIKQKDALANNNVYANLLENPNTSPIIFGKNIMLFYNNESGEPTLNLQLKRIDIGGSQAVLKQLSVNIQPGFNYISLDAAETDMLLPGMLYQLSSMNTRREERFLNFTIKK